MVNARREPGPAFLLRFDLSPENPDKGTNRTARERACGSEH